MIKAILTGVGGAMGGVVASRALENNIEIVAGIDKSLPSNLPFPVFPCFEDCNVKADVIIDFSHPSVIPSLLNHAISTNTPALIATTGMGDAEIAMINAASQKVAIFFSFNMSLGVNLLTELSRRAAAVLGDNFEIEIIEKHHNKKVDAPSGTAIMIADAVTQGIKYTPNFVYDRESVRKRREKTDIGMHSIRGGNIVGEHEIMFIGTDEVLTISHSAKSKEVFATGAYKAAHFIMGKQPGIYNMKDLI